MFLLRRLSELQGSTDPCVLVLFPNVVSLKCYKKLLLLYNFVTTLFCFSAELNERSKETNEQLREYHYDGLYPRSFWFHWAKPERCVNTVILFWTPLSRRSDGRHFNYPYVCMILKSCFSYMYFCKFNCKVYPVHACVFIKRFRNRERRRNVALSFAEECVGNKYQFPWLELAWKCLVFGAFSMERRRFGMTGAEEKLQKSSGWGPSAFLRKYYKHTDRQDQTAAGPSLEPWRYIRIVQDWEVKGH